jgi:HAMP domain-containing protein
MPLFWLSLAVALVVGALSLVYATSRGLEAFRAFKRLGRTVAEQAERISVSSAGIERHLALAAESGERLEASLERLRSSRARLNVLTSALADVRASVERVTGVIPRK